MVFLSLHRCRVIEIPMIKKRRPECSESVVPAREQTLDVTNCRYQIKWHRHQQGHVIKGAKKSRIMVVVSYYMDDLTNDALFLTKYRILCFLFGIPIKRCFDYMFEPLLFYSSMLISFPILRGNSKFLPKLSCGRIIYKCL